MEELWDASEISYPMQCKIMLCLANGLFSLVLRLEGKINDILEFQVENCTLDGS